MTTVHYQRVTMSAQQTGSCAVCGKKGKRSRTFQKTVNPFNKNADGTVRTSTEVYEAVKAEALAWAGRQFVHAKCEVAS